MVWLSLMLAGKRGGTDHALAAQMTVFQPRD